MLLPKDLLPLQYTGTWIYTKPRLFLCETDKSKIYQLDTIDMSGTFKFNAYSELECSVGRIYEDFIYGDTKVNPFYDKIEALRLLYLEGFGYFEIQDPEIVSDGIKEVKSVNAYSLEYSLSQKYLEDLHINTGEVDSVEVIYSEENETELVPVTLYNIANQELSLLHIVLKKVYGWSIGHIDASLATMSRTFDVSRTSVYDFIVKDICENFNCFAVFDTINNTINLYAEALTTKFFGDGASQSFKISPPYQSLGTVSIDSYKTLKYSYDENTGILTFENVPEKGCLIEVTDGSQAKWMTDVYISFDNLAQEVNVSYSADDIKTVLTVKGADDLSIEEVNMGLPYITDLSYYYSPDWMGQELYDAYTEYMQKCSLVQDQYTNNEVAMAELEKRIDYETGRLSLQYSVATNVNSETVSSEYQKYYVRGGSSPNYYYTEVMLPDEYNANVKYYTLSGNDLTEDKVANLFSALMTYYYSQKKKDTSEVLKLADSFTFMEKNTIASLASALSTANTTSAKDKAVNAFFDEMFDQIGLSPLKSLYYDAYTKVKEENVDAGWNNTSHEQYWNYYPVTVIVASIEKEIKDREDVINGYNLQYTELQNANTQIQQSLLLDVFFTEYYTIQGYNINDAKAKALKLLMRLTPFLREDEYTDDNFLITESDSNESILKMKQELLECGRIELSKLCEPKLEFSMDMANIYALPEFEPIVQQFQLGNLINVAIRKDYIKRARLLEVNINFNDFSDFSCEFGELTSLRTPSSIHADLLSQALSAGKSVASNASYWNKGADLATKTDEKIQQGLISATNGLFTSDQSVTIDNSGILLRKVNENGEFSPHQAWLKNNTIMLSSDGFKTSRMGLGEFTIDGTTFYGILAEAMLSGYIEGSTIVGGTIDIGDGTFVVDQYGNVTMNAASITGYVTSDELSSVENDLSSRITINGKGIETKVSKDGIISSINQSPETVAINANRISLAGQTINLTSDNITINSTNFSVDKTGKITATSGEIAGWTVYPGLFRKETTINGVDYQIYMQSTDGVSTSNAFVVRKKLSADTEWDYQFSVNYEGRLVAKNANITGSITAQDGSIAGFNIGPGGSYDNTLHKRVSGANSDYEVGIKATSGERDLAFYVKESSDNWVSSLNNFYVRNNGQLYAQDADITGKITAESGTIGGWNIGATKIYGTAGNGQVAVMQLPTDNTTFVFAAGGDNHSSYASCPFRVTKNGELYASKGTIGGFDISDNYLRNDITVSETRYQTFMQAADGSSTTTAFGVRSSTDNGSNWTYQFRVNYDGSAVMRNATITGSSTIASACIPNLNADKITAGTLDVDRIPNISAVKITSGTISTDRLSSSVITTGNFSSKTLSTGNLSVTNGGNIGVWTVNSNNYLYAISGSYGVSLSPTSVSHGQGGSATWANIVKAGQNASDERLKKNIVTFDDDKFDRIFDGLKPVQFEYGKDFLGQGIHFGYIAQDVINSFENEGENINNYSFVYETEIEDNSTEKYYQLNQTEFMALNTWQIQKLKARVAELETKLATLGV